MITKPQVLLLDEPLSALDPFLRIRMWAELKKLQRELGISFLHVTHGQDEALALADEIVVMNNARIEQSGSARDVFNAPMTEFVAKFLGGHNVMALPQGKFALRADEVRLGSEGTEAVVLSVEFQGAHVALTAKAAGEEDILALIPEAAPIAPHPGPLPKRGEGVRHTFDASPLGQNPEIAPSDGLAAGGPAGSGPGSVSGAAGGHDQHCQLLADHRVFHRPGL